MAKKRTGLDALREYEARSGRKTQSGNQQTGNAVSSGGTWRSGLDALREYEASGGGQNVKNGPYNPDYRTNTRKATPQSYEEAYQQYKQYVAEYQKQTEFPRRVSVGTAAQQAGGSQKRDYSRILGLNQLDGDMQPRVQAAQDIQKYLQFQRKVQTGTAAQQAATNAGQDYSRLIGLNQFDGELERRAAEQEKRYRETVLPDQLRGMKRTSAEMQKQLDQLYEQKSDEHFRDYQFDENGTAWYTDENGTRRQARGVRDIQSEIDTLETRKAALDSARALGQAENTIGALDEETRELLREYNKTGYLADNEGAEWKLRQKGYSYDQIKRLAEYEKYLEDFEDYQKRSQSARKFGQDAPVTSTVASSLLAPFKALGNIESLRGILPKWLGGYQNEDMPTNIYSPLYFATHESSSIRSGVMEGMGPVGQFLYQAGTSALDSAVNMAASTAIVGTTGLSGEAASSAVAETMNWVMGSQVAADSVYAGIQSGKSNQEALIDGIVEGAIEGFTEKYSVGDIIETMLSGKQVWKKAMRAFASEGAEEIASNWLNRIYDVAAKHDRGEVMGAYAEYLSKGNTKEKALALTLADMLKEDGLSFLAGGISGLAMSGAYAGTNKVTEAYNKGEQLNVIGQVMDAVESMAKDRGDKATAEAAQAVMDKVKAGQMPETAEVQAVIDAAAKADQAAQEEAAFQTYNQYADERDARQAAREAQQQTPMQAVQEDSRPQQEAAQAVIQADTGRSTEQYGQQETGSRNGEGRTESVYSGGQSRRMGAGSEIERTLERQGETVRLRNRARDLGAENISPAEAGLKDGDTTKSLLKIPVEAYGEHEKALQKAVEARGASLNIVMGRIRLANGTAVDEFIDTGTRQITVRADCTKWAMENLIDHALFHDLSTEQRNAAAQAVADRFSESELMAIAGQYVKRMRGVYEGMSEEVLFNIATEEVLADAAGRMLRYTDADATKFTETVRGILDRNGSIAAEESGQRFSYAGELARTADKETLEQAKQMEESGASAENIFRETGWFKGADGQWRFEIDDSKMETDTKWGLLRNPDARRYNMLFEKAYLYDNATAEDLQELQILEGNLKGVRKSPYYLDEIVKHDALFEAYPALRDVKVRFEANTGNKEGSYHPEENEFVLRTGLKLEPEKLKSTLIHEIQHAIQEQEGFARGASIGYWDEMIQGGYSRRENDGRIERARQEYHGIFNSAPEEFKDKVRKINRARLDGDYDTADTVIDELYDSEYADLWSRLDEAEFEWRSDRGEELNAGDLYLNTAGEIEARDVAERRNLSAEERRNRMPDTGNADTVFAEAGWQAAMDYDQETASIKEQVENSREVLNAMDVVARASVPTNLRTKDSAAAWAAERLKSTGYRVDRQGYGEIYFSKKDMDKGLRYADTAEEKAALAVLPQVLKRGIEIGDHANHKNRVKQTVTFAAPVELNGTRGNMAVVVNRNGNHYYAHRIVMPDGSVFHFSGNAKNAAQELSRGVTVSGSLADTTSAASKDSIRGESKNVKQRYSPADTETNAETDTETEDAAKKAAEGVPIFNFDAKADWAYSSDPNPFYRLMGITPPGVRIGIVTQGARAADWAGNGKAYTKALLDFVTKPDRSTKTLTLQFPNADGTYRAETVQNTKFMQDVYKYYAETVPEGQRLDEATFWMMRRKLAEGSIPARIQAMSAEAKGQAWQESSRNDFKSTGALEKMGVKVERSVGRYGRTQSIIETEKAYKQAKKELNRAIDRLGATAKEVAFAKQIADGVFDMSDVPEHYDKRVVLTLLDYMNAEAALGKDRILAQRKAIRQDTTAVLETLFKDVKDNKVQDMFTLNHRTAQRNMLKIFGDETGEKINKAIFDPIKGNESERIRFINRQFDDVREFADSTGRKSELTHEESILVQLVMEGKATEALLGDMPGNPQITKAGMKIADGMKASEAAKSEHLNKNEKQLAKMYASWVGALRMMADGKIDAVKIDNAAKAYTQKYNEFYAAINDFLVAHGYEPIGFIQNYAPHMQSEDSRSALDSALKALGLNEDTVTLPTSIAGLTANFKPNKRWNPYFLHRTSETYNFDAAKGFESYVKYMSELFYHTDDIMTVRALSDYLRRRYSPEEISSKIDEYTWLQEKLPDEQLLYLQQKNVLNHGEIVDQETLDTKIEDELEKLYADAKNESTYSNLVVWLDNYANVLAGKQTKGDRSTEENVGREKLNLGNWATRRFGAAKVAGNIATILNQASQLPVIVAEKGVRNTAAAVKDMVTGQLRKADFAMESDYLTSKKGVHFLVTDEKNMYEWALDKVGQAQEFADAMVSTIAVRAAYLEGIQKGMTHEQAMRYADKYGAAVMGDRSKGTKPVAFNSKSPVMQLVNTFQLEVANSWEHLTQDTAGFDFRMMAKKYGKDKAIKALAGVIVKYLIAAFIMNRLSDETYGGTPAQFDVLGITSNFVASGYGLSVNDALRTVMDDGWEKLTGERLFGTENEERSFDGWKAVEAAGGDIANDIPYLQNASALIGWGDNSLPAAIPTKALDKWINAVKGGKSAQDVAKATFDVGTEMIPGGSQIKKTARGIDAMLRGGVYQGYGEQTKLRYPVDNKNIGKWIQAVVFGPNGLSETGRYYAGEERAIGEKQTTAYQAMIAAGADKEESYRLIRRISKLGDGEDSKLDRLNMLLSSKVSTAGQGAYYYLMMAGDKERERIDALTGENGVLGMDEYLKASQKKLQIDADESMKASEKADAFRQWANQQGYSAAQKRGVLDAFKFAQIIMEGGGHTELYQAATEGVSEYETLRADAIAEEMAGGKTKAQAESSVNSSLRSQMKQDFQDGLADEETAAAFLKEYCGAEDEHDVYWTLEEWKGGEGWKKYGQFLDAVDKGVLADTRKVAREYMKHGVDKGDLSSQLTTHFKEAWLAATGDEATRLKNAYISAYKAIGGNADKARDNIIKWRQEANKRKGGKK